MHVQNLKLFKNPAIYYLNHHGNDVILPANLFSGHLRTLIVKSGKVTILILNPYLQKVLLYLKELIHW